MSTGRFTHHLVIVGLSVMGSPALLVEAFAQDLVFEQVGDIAIDAQDLAFDETMDLWAGASELWRLPVGSSLWEEVYDEPGFIGDILLVLSPDTLFLTSTNGVHRSTDGGSSFAAVYEEGGSLFTTRLDGLNRSLVLAGESQGGTGIAYSTDRGASFTSATFTVSTSTESTLHSAVEILDGPAAGRLVAGCFNGIFVSEDSGQTWSPSSLFGDFRYSVQRIVIGEDPASGSRRLYATVVDAQASGPQLFTSDDEGLTWTNVPDMVDAYLFVFVPEPSSLLAVERADAVDGEHIEVWQSVDGGQSWVVVGELPAEVDGGLISSEDVLIGPDSHLYVALGRNGPESEWVYRTTKPVVVANEPPLPAPTTKTIAVYPNPAEDRITVEGIEQGEEVVLYDVLGRAMLRSRTPTDIDVSALPPGVYVVRVGGESRLVTVRQH